MISSISIPAVDSTYPCPKWSAAVSKHCLHRWLVIKTLRQFKKGMLQIDLPTGERLRFGDTLLSEPTAHLRVRKPLPFFVHVAQYGGVGLGEAYTEGMWDTDDLRAVLDWFVINIQSDPALRGSSQRFKAVGF
ncbi:MAG: hypothetical protein JNG86_15205, partial [Verrucomicrobiaceae bacterium]|nr:hypothetical protein [Verrucomicrobiaceae bacterium]